MEHQLFSYLPIIKWRMGEYQALTRLKPKVKNSILPLIVVPPIEYDFESKQLKKTLQAHIETFPKRYNDKWGERRSLIDLHDSLIEARMDCGTLTVEYIFDNLRSLGSSAIPVINLSHEKNYLTAVKSIIKQDEKGFAIRVSVDNLGDLSLDKRISALINFIQTDLKNIDLIIDLEQPQVFEPYQAFSKALSTHIKKISDIKAFRSFSITSTSLAISEIKSPGGTPIRHEWYLYKSLCNELSSLRTPTFGDYTIESPSFISQDMRLLNPAGRIIYTTEFFWLARKGNSFRNNRNQMIGHCESIIQSGYYKGQNFSGGDKRIYDTVYNNAGTGNQTTWKEVAISHHITLITELTSNLSVP